MIHEPEQKSFHQKEWVGKKHAVFSVIHQMRCKVTKNHANGKENKPVF